MTIYWQTSVVASTTVLAPAVKYLFNLSLSSGRPPVHWKKSIISPVPKTAKPSTFFDFPCSSCFLRVSVCTQSFED